jgi:3-isopropylmalate/(R)-2-methylmalate dehydratase small subunit
VQVDLANQTLAVPTLALTVPFDINPYKKACLLNGYDDIDYILSRRNAIERFESAGA